MCQYVEINVTLKHKYICARFIKHFYFYRKETATILLWTGAPNRQDVLNQACNHKRAYLFQISLWKQLDTSTKMTKLFDPTLFLIRKNTVHVKLQPRMQALVTSRLGWRLNICFDSTRDWRSVPVVSWTRAWNHFQMQQFVNGKCTSFTTLMELLNTLLFIVCASNHKFSSALQ